MQIKILMQTLTGHFFFFSSRINLVKVHCNTSELTPLQMVKQDDNYYLHFEFEQTKLVRGML